MDRFSKITPFQWKLAFLILALAVGKLIYDVLSDGGLGQTAALFIGLPAVLAIIVTLTPKAKSLTGMILKGMTIALLLSGILLREGFICILMAAPLFYLVGVIIGRVIEYKRSNSKIYGLLLLPFLLLSLEGVHGSLSFKRLETVKVERIVAGSAVEVEQTLSQAPVFDRQLPLYLRLGFPRPVSASGSGLAAGDRLGIHFSGPPGFFGQGPPGDLVLEVLDRAPGHVRFRAVSDSSAVAHWLGWQETDVRWTELDPEHTRVTWTLRYERRLDPAWYFSPWERYAVKLAGAYLIETLATS